MKQKKNTKKRQKSGREVINFVLVGLAGLVFLLQASGCIMVFLHNHSGLLYEYRDYDWYLISHFMVCVIGLWLSICFILKKDYQSRVGFKLLLILLLVILLLIAREIVNRVDRFASSFFGGRIQSIEFLSDDEGFAFVDSKESDLSIYKTEDGGSSWRQVYLSDKKGSFTIFPKVYSRNSIICGLALLYDEMGSLYYSKEFSFDITSNSLVFEQDSCHISHSIERWRYSKIDSIDLLLSFNGLYSCDGADSLDHRIALLASNSFRSMVFYSEDLGKTWDKYGISHLSVGPISITEHYLYVNEIVNLRKYAFNTEKKKLMKKKQKARVIETLYPADE